MSETQSYAGAAVVAPHPAAVMAARDVLIEGGNAIEAAVAALAVISVVLPQAGGAGGDGVWLIREAGARGRTRVLDARGPLGEGVTLRRFRERDLDRIPSHGGDAILAVPGAVAGWRAALELSAVLGGRLPARRLLEPAIVSAREGFSSPDPVLRPCPEALAEQAAFAGCFMVEGRLPAAGQTRTAPPWAEVLTYLSQAGLDDFCRGDVGREIAQDLSAAGSPLTRDDFRHFEPRWREPSSLRCGLGLVEAPRSRAALTLFLCLGLFERLAASRPDSAAHLHGRIEAMKRAEAIVTEAAESGADPATLLTAPALQIQSQRIDAKRAVPYAVQPDAAEESVWIGVVDGSGLAVSLVQSVGTAFGSGCVLSKTGLLMGNRGVRFELDDDKGLVLRRGRRAPLKALPVIVAGPKGTVTSLGASDWRAAASVAAQWLAGAGLAEAIAAPRGIPEASHVTMEEDVDPSVRAALERAGHDIRPIGPGSAGEGGGVARHAGGRVEAVADPRRDYDIAGF